MVIKVLNDHGLEVIRKSGRVVGSGNDTADEIHVFGTIERAGLAIKGVVTQPTLNDSTWTKLTPSPLANRNALAIQNNTGFEIKVNYQVTDIDVEIPGFTGMSIPDTGERFYNIKSTIDVYGKFETGGSGAPDVEELS